MKARNLLMIFALIVATSAACSSGAEAERADETAATQEKALAEEEPADEETEADADAADEETAEADAEEDADMAQKQGMMAHCPMAVEETEVAVENTDKGVAMVFTTTGDVAELRERVQWMAGHHGKMHGKKKGQGKMDGQGKMHGKKKGQGKMHGKKKGHGMHGMMAKASVSAEEIDQGMKLIFTAEDDAQVDKLQQHMAQHVERVKSGTCPMKYNKSADKSADKSASDDS